MRHRGGVAAYFVITALIILSGFSVLPVTHTAIFILLLTLYLLPVLYSVSGRVHTFPALIYVVVTPIIPMLLIIDPIEIGLWGHDPYLHSMASLRQIVAGDLHAAMQVGSYPGTYIFVDSLHSILGLPVEIVAKFVPLMVASLPLFLFLAMRRRVGSSDALVIAIIAASTRTLLTFETKFVDEILAVALAFVLILTYFVNRSRAQRLIAVLTIGVIVMSHHAVTFLIALTIAFWALGPEVLGQLSRMPVIGHVVTPLIPDDKSIAVTAPAVLFAGLLAVSVPLYGGQRFVQLLVVNILNAGSGVTSELSGGGVTTSPDGFFAALSAFLTVSLVVLTLFSIWSVYQTPSLEWEVGWLTCIVCLGALYAVTLAIGRVVPLDPIRLLIFIVPMLGAVAVAQLDAWPDNWRAMGAITIAVLLILPGLAAIPPHLLITDISHKPAVAEGHFTEKQWTASQWAAEYDPDTIAAHERDLWAATQSDFTADEYATCEESSFVARDGLQQHQEGRRSIFYSSADVRLWVCSK